MTGFLTLMLMRIRDLRDREDGQAAVEYGVLVALIIAVAVGVITLLGADVTAAFQKIVTAI